MTIKKGVSFKLPLREEAMTRVSEAEKLMGTLQIKEFEDLMAKASHK